MEEERLAPKRVRKHLRKRHGNGRKTERDQRQLGEGSRVVSAGMGSSAANLNAGKDRLPRRSRPPRVARIAPLRRLEAHLLSAFFLTPTTTISRAPSPEHLHPKVFLLRLSTASERTQLQPSSPLRSSTQSTSTSWALHSAGNELTCTSPADVHHLYKVCRCRQAHPPWERRRDRCAPPSGARHPAQDSADALLWSSRRCLRHG